MKLGSLTAIAQAFAKAGVRYLVAGGMAVVAHFERILADERG